MNIIDYKECSRCHQIKKMEEFTKNRALKSGYNTWCKKCHCEHMKNKYKAAPEEKKKEINEWKKNNRERVKNYMREYYRRNKNRAD